MQGFLGRLGLSQGGKTNRIVRDQIERISHCKLTFHLNQNGVRGIANQSIVESAIFFGDEGDRRNNRNCSPGGTVTPWLPPPPVGRASVRCMRDFL
jgi:hypothetical protein